MTILTALSTINAVVCGSDSLASKSLDSKTHSKTLTSTLYMAIFLLTDDSMSSKNFVVCKSLRHGTSKSVCTDIGAIGGTQRENLVSRSSPGRS